MIGLQKRFRSGPIFSALLTDIFTCFRLPENQIYFRTPRDFHSVPLSLDEISCFVNFVSRFNIFALLLLSALTSLRHLVQPTSLNISVLLPLAPPKYVSCAATTSSTINNGQIHARRGRPHCIRNRRSVGRAMNTVQKDACKV